MDIGKLGNILNALKFNKKVEPSQKATRDEGLRESSKTSSSEGDSVTISDEAFLKSSIEGVAEGVKDQDSQVREAKVSQIKDKLSRGEYEVSAEDVASRMLQATDIYEELK